MTVSHIFLVWQDSWQFRGGLIKYFAECLWFGWCFLMVTLELLIWWRKSHRVMCITPYQGFMLSTWLMTVEMSLDHMARVVFVRFHHCKVTLFLSFYILLLVGNHYGQPTLKQWSSMFHLLKKEGVSSCYFLFLYMNICLFSPFHIFIQSLTCITTGLKIFIFILHSSYLFSLFPWSKIVPVWSHQEQIQLCFSDMVHYFVVQDGQAYHVYFLSQTYNQTFLQGILVSCTRGILGSWVSLLLLRCHCFQAFWGYRTSKNKSMRTS